MRIIKYIFLLLLLALIAVSVFVATQKGDFDVTQSTVINVPKTVLFNYVNDYKNWEDWDSWKEDDPGMKFTFPENTVGKGASYSWSGANGSGKMTTVFVKENDSIAQKVVYGDNEADAYVSLKEINGKTKITLSSKGNVGFMSKVYATFTGGVNKMLEDRFLRSLNNLNKVITHEINTFDIKVNGIVNKPGTFYVKQTTSCKTVDMQNRLLIMLPKIVRFFEKNNLTMNGTPFIIYHASDPVNKTMTFSVCAPLREEIFLSPESDISVGFLEPFSALKTTLTGDYSHRDAARKKALEYMTQNSILEYTTLKRMDVYVKSASDIRYPSKWVTELLIPVKTVAAPPVSTVTPPKPVNEPIISQ